MYWKITPRKRSVGIGPVYAGASGSAGVSGSVSDVGSPESEDEYVPEAPGIPCRSAWINWSDGVSVSAPAFRACKEAGSLFCRGSPFFLPPR